MEKISESAEAFDRCVIHTLPKNCNVLMMPCKWVSIKLFALMSGMTCEAVRSNCYKGTWPKGVLWTNAPNGRVMINWQAVDAWVESGNRLH